MCDLFPANSKLAEIVCKIKTHNWLLKLKLIGDLEILSIKYFEMIIITRKNNSLVIEYDFNSRDVLLVGLAGKNRLRVVPHIP